MRPTTRTATATLTTCVALLLTPPAHAALEPLPLAHEPHLDHTLLTPLKDLLTSDNLILNTLRAGTRDLPIPINRA